MVKPQVYWCSIDHAVGAPNPLRLHTHPRKESPVTENIDDWHRWNCDLRQGGAECTCGEAAPS